MRNAILEDTSYARLDPPGLGFYTPSFLARHPQRVEIIIQGINSALKEADRNGQLERLEGNMQILWRKLWGNVQISTISMPMGVMGLN